MGANAGALETKIQPADPHLLAVLEAWPAIPDAIKSAILTLVRAAGAGQ